MYVKRIKIALQNRSLINECKIHLRLILSLKNFKIKIALDNFLGILYFPKNDEVISKEISLNGVWEKNEVEWLKKTVKSGDVCINVGANVGYFSILMSMLVGQSGKVYAIEPNPALIPFLKANVLRKQIGPIQILPFAAGSKSEFLNLFLNETNCGDNRLFDPRITNGGGNYIDHGFSIEPNFVRVPVLPLDEIIKNEKVNVVLIDAQGWDFEVIKGMNEIISKYKPYILMEYVPQWFRDMGISPLEIIENLIDLGYLVTCPQIGIYENVSPAEYLKRIENSKNYYVNLALLPKNLANQASSIVKQKDTYPFTHCEIFGNQVLVQGISLQDPYFIGIKGVYEISFQRVIQELLSEDDIAIDVGANIGLTSIILSRHLVRGRVYSFEPSSISFELLNLNLKTNDCSNVSVENKAVSDTEATLDFRDNSAYGYILKNPEIAKNAEVKSITLDNYFSNQEKIDFIKIDVEGLEPEVINGAINLIRSLKPLIYLEFNSYCLIAHGNHNPLEFLEKLREEFPFIYRVNKDINSEYVLEELEASELAMKVFHDNVALHGSVDDLLLSHNPLVDLVHRTVN